MNQWKGSALFICLMVAVLTAITLLFASDRGSLYQLDSLIETIDRESDLSHRLRQINEHLQFLTDGYQPPPHTPDALQIAKRRFQLAEKLHSLHDDRYLEEALKHYEQAIALFPSLSHGWPYYNMGVIFEKQKQYEEAISHYQTVLRYDFGRLALNADYRIAVIHQRQNGKPIDFAALYNYLRFASENVMKDIQPFVSSTPDGSAESDYLSSLVLYAQNRPADAARRMAAYAQRRPDDYSAHYYLDLFTQNEPQHMYPADGNLLSSCFAPYGSRNGAILLTHNMPVRCDLYRTAPDAEPLRFEMQLENPVHEAFQCILRFNGETRIVDCSPRENETISATFSASAKRNFLEVQLNLPGGGDADRRNNPMFIKMRSLHVSLAPTESSE
ncbi:MAG: tetratricopeptide repeat protein [Candidatus Omnitrophota bacterium]|jgi:tetratricopeptide (TPR) repeat protein|nr:MAG: tetratricopeptide repeat protein [Candidatus Omnitrophota bacterium]